MLENSPTALMVIIWLGSLTALLGAACGLVENDIKRVIAFSTSSQLGYLFVACGERPQKLFQLLEFFLSAVILIFLETQ